MLTLPFLNPHPHFPCTLLKCSKQSLGQKTEPPELHQTGSKSPYPFSSSSSPNQQTFPALKKHRFTNFHSRGRTKMGYVLRVRLSSFFTGIATASAAGLYFLHKDYKLAHESISNQVKSIRENFEKRISAMEKLKERISELESSKAPEAPQQVDVSE